MTTTRDLMAEACALVGIKVIVPLKGSTEPLEFYQGVATKLGIATHPLGKALMKRELAEAIVATAGLRWDPAWDGRHTASKGGGSISNEGLHQILAALHALHASGSL